MLKILVIDDENNIIEKFLAEMEKEIIPIINLSKKYNTLCYKNIKMNKENYEVFNGNEKVPLTAKEFEILKLFMENPNKVFSRELILDKVWGYDYYGDPKIVNTHIKNIRKKLKIDIIKTVIGAGYKLEN